MGKGKQEEQKRIRKITDCERNICESHIWEWLVCRRGSQSSVVSTNQTTLLSMGRPSSQMCYCRSHVDGRCVWKKVWLRFWLVSGETQLTCGSWKQHSEKNPSNVRNNPVLLIGRNSSHLGKTVSRLLHKVLCVLIKYQTIWLRLLTGIITSNHRKKPAFGCTLQLYT